jgi:hypothetical protein
MRESRFCPTPWHSDATEPRPAQAQLSGAGASTEEAILGDQRAQWMTLTGRLDMDTLDHLRLLPTQRETHRSIYSGAPK